MGRGPSIEGRKNAEDAKRGKIFTKLIREITVAARNGGDPASNARLRIAIEKALSANMTKDTIERAVKRGSGADGADDMEELRYEGYGPGGIALIIDAMTDNSVRTVADVRHALSKHGGNLGTSGSVSFQFARVGELVFESDSPEAEKRYSKPHWKPVPMTSSVRQVRSTVLCAPENFETVKTALIAAGFAPVSDAVVMRPENRIAVSGEAAETFVRPARLAPKNLMTCRRFITTPPCLNPHDGCARASKRMQDSSRTCRETIRYSCMRSVGYCCCRLRAEKRA